MLLTPDPAGAHTGTPMYSDAQYAAAMQEISDATDHVAYTSVADLLGSYAQMQALGMVDSNVHPYCKGHGVIARAFYNALTSVRAPA